MQERRKQPRKYLMSYSQVFDLYGGDLLGYLGDMNLLGVMVIGNRVMPVNTKLTLAIELPELENVTATRMTVPARVAWCEQDLSPDYFNIGFEFQELQPPQTKIIQAIIANYEFRRDVPTYNIKPKAKNRWTAGDTTTGCFQNILHTHFHGVVLFGQVDFPCRLIPL